MKSCKNRKRDVNRNQSQKYPYIVHCVVWKHIKHHLVLSIPDSIWYTKKNNALSTNFFTFIFTFLLLFTSRIILLLGNLRHQVSHFFNYCSDSSGHKLHTSWEITRLMLTSTDIYQFYNVSPLLSMAFIISCPVNLFFRPGMRFGSSVILVALAVTDTLALIIGPVAPYLNRNYQINIEDSFSVYKLHRF